MSKVLESKIKEVEVMRTPNRNYKLTPQFGWDESPDWLIDLFGDFDDDIMYFDVDGDILAVKRNDPHFSSSPITIYANTHDGATYSWCKLYYSYLGQFKMTVWRGDWNPIDRIERARQKLDQWKQQEAAK